MAARVTDGTKTRVLVADRAADRPLPQGDPGDLPAAPDDDVDGDDVPVRFIYYTSGTTAEPKGARHGDRSLRAAALGMAQRLHLADDDRFALVFPFTHVAGGLYMYAAMAYGFALLLDEAFDPETTPSLLRRERVTQGGAGTFFHQVYLQAQRGRPEG